MQGWIYRILGAGIIINGRQQRSYRQYAVASKMVPNRLLFGDSFDRPGGSKAFWVQNKQSPSLERGPGGRLWSCESDGFFMSKRHFR
jgi:hypothetical protein